VLHCADNAFELLLTARSEEKLVGRARFELATNGLKVLMLS
jgi:hypothetical protein